MKKIIGGLLILLGLGIVIFVFYKNSGVSTTTRPFSTYTLTASSWEKYKGQFINSDGRVIDTTQGDVTTSEGQSYALLRAVWSDDKDAFDLIWKWTSENLKRPNDSLFGWKWGKKDNEKYGFLSPEGRNSASDADSDIALALIFAGNRWHDPKYTEEAKKILEDLWALNTDIAAKKRYLVAGNWAAGPGEIIVNPSYFAPYAWRIFANVDPERNWLSLIDPAYELLNISSFGKLDKEKSAGLPPDWISITKSTGEIRAVNSPTLTTNYSFDAMRIPWRIALDYEWNNDQKAYDYLSKSFKKLYEEYNQNGKLSISYSHEGQELDSAENPAMYATALGYFAIFEPELAKKIYEEKIIKLYSNDLSSFNSNIPYYEQNWLWFGTAFYNNQLVPYISN